jgi:hypothetical protein
VEGFIKHPAAFRGEAGQEKRKPGIGHFPRKRVNAREDLCSFRMMKGFLPRRCEELEGPRSNAKGAKDEGGERPPVRGSFQLNGAFSFEVLRVLRVFEVKAISALRWLGKIPQHISISRGCFF